MNKKILIIGAGKQAPKHIRGLRSVPGIDVCIYDIDTDKARSLAEKLDLTLVTDVGQALAEKDITAVDICTPVPWHMEYIEMAVESGADFFCEKPLCETIEQAEKIQQLVESNASIGMVGYNYRFAPAMIEIQKILAPSIAEGVSPVIGQVTSAFLRAGGRGGHELWKHQAAKGGGAINEILVHLLDLAIGFFGPVKKVQVLDIDLRRPVRKVGQVENQAVDAEDYALVKLVMENGVQVICEADLLTPSFEHYVNVRGTNGNLFGSIQSEFQNFVFCEEDSGGYKSGFTNLSFGPRDFFLTQMSEFVTSLTTRKPPSNGTIESSVQIMRAIHDVKMLVE